MQLFGIDVRKNEEEGNLIVLNYDECYIENGEAECVKILAHWKEMYERFRKRGLGLRATGEMGCFFEHDKVRELLRYEYATHRFLDLSRDGIRAYNVNTIVNTGYTEVIMPLVRAHGWAIFTSPVGSMVYEPENVEDYDVERLLKIRIDRSVLADKGLEMRTRNRLIAIFSTIAGIFGGAAYHSTTFEPESDRSIVRIAIELWESR